MKQNLSKVIADDICCHNTNLYNDFLKLSNRNELAYPYLTIPTSEYCQADIRVVVENRETNGWGDKELKEGCLKSINDMISIYDIKINEDWDYLGVIWPMYIALRGLSEGDNPYDILKDKVGFMHSNVALIGREYDKYGYDSSIKALLIRAQDSFLRASRPHILLLGIGFGTKGHTEKNYLEILEGTFLGKLIRRERIEKCETPLYRLFFENSGDMIIFGYGHPQGLPFRPIVDFLTEFLIKHIRNSNKISEQGSIYSVSLKSYF
ncbi:MAG: hypothetical protein K2J63_07170 [Muribaculaceae bacterium]|nr:hypothetical protein [Muribaculaceae bacterium]